MKLGKLILLVGIAFPVALVLATLCVLLTRPERLSITPEQMALIPNETNYATPFIAEGITPEIITAEESDLQDNDEVIGVVVNGEPRAYKVAAFFGMPDHVVNDVVAGAPVCVTYCDQTDRVRVFTSEQSSARIDLHTGGWSGESMLLLLNEEYFEQDAEDAPLDDLPFERTTWSNWKASHSATNVYIGRSDVP